MTKQVSREKVLSVLYGTDPFYRLLRIVGSPSALFVIGLPYFLATLALLALASGALFTFKEWLIFEHGFAPLISNLVIFPVGALILAVLWMYIGIALMTVLLQFFYELAPYYRERVIRRLTPEHIDPDLLRTLITYKPWQPYRNAGRRQIIRQCSRPDNLPVLYECLHGKNRSHQWCDAIHQAIKNNYDATRVVPMMLKILSDDMYVNSHRTAIVYLSDFKIPEALPVIQQKLQATKRYTEQLDLLRALQYYADPTTIPDITALLTDVNLQKRRHNRKVYEVAIATLQIIGTDEALAIIDRWEQL